MIKILAITPNGKTDALATGIIEGLVQCNDVELFCTNKGNSAVNIVSAERARELSTIVDYVFVIHGKRPGDYSLLNDIDWEKVVVIDGSEWSFNYLPINNLGSIEKLVNEEWAKKAKYYFKRECYPQHCAMGIRPLQFTALDSDFGHHDEEKTIDVLCAFPRADHHWPDHNAMSYRRMAINACKELQDEGYKIVVGTVTDYLRNVNRSWITIDAYGGGEFNRRTKQIIANKSALLAKKYQIQLHDLIEDEHYYAWDSTDELKNKIRQLLANKSQLQKTIDRSYDHICNKHTSVATAQYILNEIQQ